MALLFAFHLDLFVSLDDVADTDIVERFDVQAAVLAGRNLLDVVLEAAERGNPAVVYDHAVAEQADAGAAGGKRPAPERLCEYRQRLSGTGYGHCLGSNVFAVPEYPYPLGLLAALGVPAGTAVFRGVSAARQRFYPGAAVAAGRPAPVPAAGYAVDAVYQWLYRLLHLPALETKLDALTARILQNIVGSKE